MKGSVMVRNGEIPLASLVRVQPGLYLTPLAAASWFRIVAGVQAQFGWTPRLTDAYRTYAEQVRIFVERYVAQATGGGYYGDDRWWNGVRYVRRRGFAAAAVPGTSNHGNATAVDADGLGKFDSLRFNQFASVATRNGWSIAEGRSVNEPWHWTKNSASFVNNPIQSVGSVPTVPDIDPIDPLVPIEEDDMFPPIFIRRHDGLIAAVAGNGAVALSAAEWDVWGNLLGAAREFAEGCGAMDDGPFGAVVRSFGGWSVETKDSVLGALAGLLTQFNAFDVDVRGDLLNKGATLAALVAAVKALATGQGLDPAAIEAAAKAGAQAALAELTLVVKP